MHSRYLGLKWLYMFPPFCLIGRTLLKIQRYQVEFACLVAPAWSGTHRYTGNVDGSNSTAARRGILATESRPQIVSSANRGESVPNRMAYLRQTYEAQGFSQSLSLARGRETQMQHII